VRGERGRVRSVCGGMATASCASGCAGRWPRRPWSASTVETQETTRSTPPSVSAVDLSDAEAGAEVVVEC
jgi:hypothetical protein